MTISDQLRQAVREYGSVYSVARDSGIPQSILQRFMTDKRDMYLETAGRLCEFFDLRLAGPVADSLK